MRILISAHPRSGTLYTTKLLNHLNIKVRHEKGGEDGTVSWKHITYSEKKNYDIILHQTRHPLKVISSAIIFKNFNFKYMFKFIGKPPKNDKLTFLMWTWLKWNKYIGRKANWRYKIEDIKIIFPEFCKQIGLPPSTTIPSISTKIHSRKHPDLTWNDLCENNKTLCRKVAKLAEKYGYEV
jgi:hypothetical protein